MMSVFVRALLFVGVVLFGASCSRTEAPQASPASVPASLPLAAESETTSTTIASTTSVPNLDAARAVSEPPAEASEPASVDEICATLGGLFEERAALRENFLTAPADETFERLDQMRSSISGLIPPAFPHFSPDQLFYLVEVESILPHRLHRGGAVYLDEAVKAEAQAETVHEFAHDFCPEIPVELIDVGPVGDLAQSVYDAEEARRLTEYCSAAGSILDLRHTVLQSLENATFETTGREAWGEFLHEFEIVELVEDVNDSFIVIENGPYLEFASDLEYERRVGALFTTVLDARLALTDPSVPLNRFADSDVNDAFTRELLESFAELCPELPAEQLTHTPLSERGVRTVYVTPGDWVSREDDMSAEVCDQMDMMLSLYVAATEVVGNSDGSNENHWLDIRAYGVQITQYVYQLENNVQAVFGRDAKGAQYVPSDVARALYNGEEFGSESNEHVTDNMAVLAELAATHCSGMPPELLNPSDQLFAHIAQRIDERDRLAVSRGGT